MASDLIRYLPAFSLRTLNCDTATPTEKRSLPATDPEEKLIVRLAIGKQGRNRRDGKKETQWVKLQFEVDKRHLSPFLENFNMTDEHEFADDVKLNTILNF